MRRYRELVTHVTPPSVEKVEKVSGSILALQEARYRQDSPSHVLGACRVAEVCRARSTFGQRSRGGGEGQGEVGRKQDDVTRGAEARQLSSGLRWCPGRGGDAPVGIPERTEDEARMASRLTTRKGSLWER